MSGPCAFCGHPDQRHRIIDAIDERIAAGESEVAVLEDYGMTAFEAIKVKREILDMERRNDPLRDREN